MNKKLFLVVSGPSGVGKTLFIDKILKHFPQFKKPVSHTTRQPRKGEKEGQAYYFLNREKFQSLKEQNYFLECAEVYNEFYGMSGDEIHRIWEDQNCWAVKDLDVQGTLTVKKAFPKNVLTLFLLPPDLETLRKRFVQRGDSAAFFEMRLALAEKEIKQAIHYDYKIVNDSFDKTWKEIYKIVENLVKMD